MRILCIEDDPARIIWLTRALPNSSIVWALTPAQVAYYVDAGPWDVICVDHDLGMDDTARVDDGSLSLPWNGASAARAFGGSIVASTRAVWVWSNNPVGSQNIAHHLARHKAELECDTHIHCEPFRRALPQAVDRFRI